MFFCNQCYDWFSGVKGEHNCHGEIKEFDVRPLDEIYPHDQNKTDRVKQSKYEFKSYNYWKNKHHIDNPRKKPPRKKKSE